MRLAWWWLFPVMLSAESSFITPFEYGKMLYENPRGIGCVHCHGKEGEGSIIAQYKHKGKLKPLIAPPINELSYERFSQATLKDNKVMPKYHLEDSELQAIYRYLQEMKRYKSTPPAPKKQK